jgi:hypothetical protein
VSARRWLPLVLGVTALLALAALASRGHPLGGARRGSGPTPAFFDYTFTTIAIVFVGIVVLFFVALSRREFSTPEGRPRFYPLTFVLMFLGCTLLALLIAHARLRFVHPGSNKPAKPAASQQANGAKAPTSIGRRKAHLRWDEIAAVAALLGVAGLAAYATRKTKPMRPLRVRPQEEVAAALDDSLDDLRAEPDVRRAIVAAYARMERALAASGLPRRPSEAPFEYLDRALRDLDTSAGAVRRLTDLFERAKFSHHDPDEAMRSEAIDALVAVRDELRAPTEAAA